MAKSKGVGRGGARKGAGRKPKALISEANRPEVIKAAEIQIERMAKEGDGPASALAPLAYATLQDVMVSSPFPAPRVSAARAIIDLAKEERLAAGGAAAGPGKKEIAKATAHARAVGKFAAPPPPGVDRLQ